MVVEANITTQDKLPFHRTIALAEALDNGRENRIHKTDGCALETGSVVGRRHHSMDRNVRRFSGGNDGLRQKHGMKGNDIKEDDQNPL